MAHSLSPNEKQAIDDILNEAANKFAPDLVTQTSLQQLDEKSKQLWGDDWNDSIATTPRTTTPSYSSQNKPFSQLIREKNPSLFKTTQFDSDSDSDDQGIEPTQTPSRAFSKPVTPQDKFSNNEIEVSEYKGKNENENQVNRINLNKSNLNQDNDSSDDNNYTYITNKSKPSHSKISANDPVFASKILKKAKESKLLSSYKYNDSDDDSEESLVSTGVKSFQKQKMQTPKAVTPLEKHKKVNPTKSSAVPSTTTKKKVPSLYERSIKKEHIIESAFDRFDIARLRQDNIEARQTIAKLQAALDKANLENEKLRKSLQESEKIRMKQKMQISDIMS